MKYYNRWLHPAAKQPVLCSLSLMHEETLSTGQTRDPEYMALKVITGSTAKLAPAVLREKAETCKCTACIARASQTMSKVCIPMGWKEADLVCSKLLALCVCPEGVLLAGDTG